MKNLQAVILTEEELQERLAYWQKRLRLQDWIIQAKIVRGTEIDGSANVNYNLKSKQALIRMAEPEDYNPAYMLPLDMEWNLVHELLHIHLAPLCPEECDAEEQAIESITTGLISMERELKIVRQGSKA